MVKSKKPKKVVNLRPEFVLDPKAPQVPKRKKKNAPDRPQPEWMFPADDANPVLNPKTKSQEQLDKEKADHDRVIKYLQYRSVSTPVKAPPPALLLTLVGAFLSTYGFNSTSRLYTTELSARKKLDEWKVLLDQRLPKGFPDLVKLFKVGQKTYEEQKELEETSSSESESESEEELPSKTIKGEKFSKEMSSKADGTSSDESLDSEDSGDSDEEMEDAPPAAKPATKTQISKQKNSSSSSSSSSSDSDADDEKEPAGVQVSPAKPPTAPTSSPLVEKLTRESSPKPGKSVKVEIRGRGKSGAVELSSSEDNEESSPEERDFKGAAKAAKPVPATAVPLPKSDSDESASSDDTSSSGPDSSSPVKPSANSTIGAIVASGDNARHGSSSSETLKGTSDQKATSTETSVSSSSSDSDTSSSEPSMGISAVKSSVTATKSTKRKHSDESEDAPVSKKQAAEQQKKTNTPFERVPKNTPVDSRFTNKYKSYDYADRAYQDLSVTKGKGFTKEKNKKKRGSYRGGAIDVGGGKGIKFDD